MDILLLSDLHFEMRRHNVDQFFSKLTASADVLVLAGDVCAGWQIPTILGAFCHRFDRVLYVHGNHEFYGSDRDKVLGFTKQAVQENPNLSWLDCNSVQIDGRWFHGAPMWFKEAPLAPKWQMNDFTEIQAFESWVYAENSRAVRYLSDHVEVGDVVVTHYLPSTKSHHPKYARFRVLDPFFITDVEGLIQVSQPALWLHGHTHASLDYAIGDTRVVSNPHGYGRENDEFDYSKVIRLPKAPVS